MTTGPAYQDLAAFKLPKGFRGRSAVWVQLWWLVEGSLFRFSPQFLYGFRRFLLRAFGAKIGKDVLIRPTVRTRFPWKVEIEDRVWVGDDVELYSLGPIRIGHDSVISQRSYLCAATHLMDRTDFAIEARAIDIASEVWLAADVFVHPGLHIARGCVVAARSTVTKDLTCEGAVYAGTPAVLTKKSRRALPLKAVV